MLILAVMMRGFGKLEDGIWVLHIMPLAIRVTVQSIEESISGISSRVVQ
jgi:hypothetical protein